MRPPLVLAVTRAVTPLHTAASSLAGGSAPIISIAMPPAGGRASSLLLEPEKNGFGCSEGPPAEEAEGVKALRPPASCPASCPASRPAAASSTHAVAAAAEGDGGAAARARECVASASCLAALQTTSYVSRASCSTRVGSSTSTAKSAT